MARIYSGVLGATTGKIGGLVAERWKGINYIRERGEPKDAKSELQNAHRKTYTDWTNFYKAHATNLYNIWLKGLEPKLAPYNIFMKQYLGLDYNSTFYKPFVKQYQMNPLWGSGGISLTKFETQTTIVLNATGAYSNLIQNLDTVQLLTMDSITNKILDDIKIRAQDGRIQRNITRKYEDERYNMIFIMIRYENQLERTGKAKVLYSTYINNVQSVAIDRPSGLVIS